jgi:hypothetical protein
MNSENKELELCLDVINFLLIVTTYLLIPILNYENIIEIDKNVINKDEFTYNEKITINMMNNEQMFNVNLRAEIIINSLNAINNVNMFEFIITDYSNEIRDYVRFLLNNMNISPHNRDIITEQIAIYRERERRSNLF